MRARPADTNATPKSGLVRVEFCPNRARFFGMFRDWSGFCLPKPEIPDTSRPKGFWDGTGSALPKPEILDTSRIARLLHFQKQNLPEKRFGNGKTKGHQFYQLYWRLMSRFNHLKLMEWLALYNPHLPHLKTTQTETHTENEFLIALLHSLF